MPKPDDLTLAPVPAPRRSLVVRNLANVVSILGVLPVCVLFLPGGLQYVIPFIIFNNVMDDLDGIVAAKLKIQSTVGAALDNVCDGAAHTVIVLMIAIPLGGLATVAGALAAIAIWVRGISRIVAVEPATGGSPTNELMRHLLFVLLLAGTFEFDPALAVAGLCVVHTVSMLLSYQLPGLIRGLARSTGAVAGVNAVLILAWLVPATAPAIAAVFGATYVNGLVLGTWRRFTTHSGARAPAEAAGDPDVDANAPPAGPSGHPATA